MKFSLDKYTYYVHTTKSGAKEVIAISTYAGKPVKGTAKCDPRDEYKEQRGKELAAARCNARIAGKRKERANKMYQKAEAELKAAAAYYEKMSHYKMDADREYDIAVAEANALAADM